MSEFSEQLRQLRLGLADTPSADDFVDRVLEACAGDAPAASAGVAKRAARPFRAGWLLGGVVAVAAGTLLGVGHWPSSPADPMPSAFVARGASTSAISATVQAFVGHAVTGVAPPLLEGAELRAGDGIVVRYSNPAPRKVYLMVFAVDERAAVHWLHPAYLSESTNPTSLELEPGASERLLPEVAEPEAPAPGTLRVYGLLTSVPLDVKSVERRLTGRMSDVAAAFPEAEVEEWRCTWRAR